MKRFVLAILLAATCFSTSIVPRSIEEMTQDSSDVVIGSAGTPRAVWNASHTMIYTLTPVRIERALKGKRSGTVIVAQMGGTLDGITTKISGVRHFRANERSALFLRQSVDMPGAFVISSMIQGHYTIDAAGNVSNGVAGVRVLNQAGQNVSEFSVERMKLSDLERRVKAVAK
jgi:hypothetical protein